MYSQTDTHMHICRQILLVESTDGREVAKF